MVQGLVAYVERTTIIGVVLLAASGKGKGADYLQ